MKERWQQLISLVASSGVENREWPEALRSAELLLIDMAVRPETESVFLADEFVRGVHWSECPELARFCQRLCIRIGRIWDDLGEWQRACDILEFGRSGVLDLEDPSVHAVLLMELGDLHRRSGRMESALAFQEKARDLAESRDLSREQLDALNNIARIVVEQGRLDEAEELFFRVLDGAGQMKDERLAGHAGNNLGVIACMRGDYREGAGRFIQAVCCREAAGDHKGLAEVYHNLAMAYKDLHQYDRALEYVEKALEHVQSAGNAGLEANIILTRLSVIAEQGDLEYGIALALRLIQRQMRMGDEPGIADTQRIMGRMYVRGRQFEDGCASLKSALVSFRRMGMHPCVAECLEDLGRCEMQRNRGQAAALAWKEAEEIYTRMKNLHGLERIRELRSGKKNEVF